jgi:uroporphyrinogen-III synthase
MRDNDRAAVLAGVHVLVTRPAHQAGPLCALIAGAGGTASIIPVIEIAGPADRRTVDGILARLAGFDIAVFVSANAVDQALALLEHRGGWPGGPRIATVGRGSAAALARHGLHTDICPPARFDSEGLLAEPAMQQVAGLDIVILRGDGGRGLLADTLVARGARVVHAEVYQRRLPDEAAAQLARIATGAPIDVIVVTSNEGLQNLYQAAGEACRGWLTSRQLVVISERAAVLARQLGFAQPARVAAEASDAGLMETIRAWRADHPGQNREAQRVH